MFWLVKCLVLQEGTVDFFRFVLHRTHHEEGVEPGYDMNFTVRCRILLNGLIPWRISRLNARSYGFVGY